MVFETTKHEVLDAYIEAHYRHVDRVHRLESKTDYAPGVFLFLFVFIVGSIFWGIPWASNTLADILPAKAMTYIGQGALESMDKIVFYESLLKDQRQNELRAKFSSLLPEEDDELAYRLIFRQGGFIGANAFALSDGTIVMTDELVELANHDDELLSILLHEIDHVVHRYSLRQIISHSGLAVLTAAFTGDVVSAGTLMLALPGILMKSSYSRELEAEADTYSLEKMKRLGMKSDHFANIMDRLEREFIELEEGEEQLEFENDWLEYFSSHPSTDDRIARFRTVKGAENENELPIPVLLSEIKNDHEEDIFNFRAIFEKGDYKELEEIFGKHQRNYENGSGSEIPAELAYECLAFSDPDYKAVFDTWIEASPDLYVPYLAKATYYFNLATTKNDTYQLEEAIEEIASDIELTRDKAITDAKKALELKPTLTLPYSDFNRHSELSG